MHAKNSVFERHFESRYDPLRSLIQIVWLNISNYVCIYVSFISHYALVYKFLQG